MVIIAKQHKSHVSHDCRIHPARYVNLKSPSIPVTKVTTSEAVFRHNRMHAQHAANDRYWERKRRQPDTILNGGHRTDAVTITIPTSRMPECDRGMEITRGTSTFVAPQTRTHPPGWPHRAGRSWAAMRCKQTGYVGKTTARHTLCDTHNPTVNTGVAIEDGWGLPHL